MSNTVCNAVTHTVSRGMSNAVRRCVQNQNQNQTVVTAVCGVSGYSIHPSNGYLRLTRATKADETHGLGGGY